MKTRHLHVHLAAAALLGAAALLPLPALAATGTGTATATVIVPITISSTQNLAFGRFSANTGGTVVIGTDSARSKTGTLALSSTGSTQTAASFNIGGDGVSTYSITLPADSVVVIDDGASHTMAVNSFISNPATTGTLTAGAQVLLVGATLTVASAQVAGSYTGTFSVTVEYN